MYFENITNMYFTVWTLGLKDLQSLIKKLLK